MRGSETRGACAGATNDRRVINLNRVQTVSKNRVGGIIATLSSSGIGEIREALLFARGY